MTDSDNNAKKVKGTLISLAVLLTILAVFIPAAIIFPYKEILECKTDNCSVEKHYIIKEKNYTYLFNRKDELRIHFHTVHTIRCFGNIAIINSDDKNEWIFRNSFHFTGASARKVLNLIKSDKPYIKVYKYWFGYKIEE